MSLFSSLRGNVLNSSSVPLLVHNCRIWWRKIATIYRFLNLKIVREMTGQKARSTCHLPIPITFFSLLQATENKLAAIPHNSCAHISPFHGVNLLHLYYPHKIRGYYRQIACSISTCRSRVIHSLELEDPKCVLKQSLSLCLRWLVLASTPTMKPPAQTF
jgi:hypothetical protein